MKHTQLIIGLFFFVVPVLMAGITNGAMQDNPIAQVVLVSFWIVVFWILAGANFSEIKFKIE